MLTVATGEDIEVGVVLMGGVEHSAGGGGGGKKDPLASGIGRTGLSAVPTTFPIPGKFLAADSQYKALLGKRKARKSIPDISGC